MTMQLSLRIVPALAIWPTLALGCPTAAEGEGEGEDPAAEACEHMADGPDIDVTAGGDFATAPDVSEPHTRHDVTLIDVVGGKGGSVTYAASETTDHLLFLDASVPVAFFDGTSTPIVIEDTSEDICAGIPVSHTVELPIGTVEIRFGPTTEESVSIVIEAGAHDD